MKEIFLELVEKALYYAEKNNDTYAMNDIVDMYKKVNLECILEDDIVRVYDAFIHQQKCTYEHYSKKMWDKYAPRDAVGNPISGKGVIYTVVTGGYDDLVIPEYRVEGMDYVYFTDNSQLKSDFYSVRQLDNPSGLSPLLLQKYAKTHCDELLPEYDFSIYLDGKFTIIGDIRDYISKYSLGRSMLCFPHFERETIDEELEELIRLEKDNPQVMIEQVERYHADGFSGYGMIDAACLVRKHGDSLLQKVMNDWWMEILNNSTRDQLSFGYACWKNDFKYDLSDLCSYMNPFIRAMSHK